MSLERDLAPRLKLIRRLVRDRYADHLHSQGNGTVPHKVMLNEDEVIVPDPVTVNDPAHSPALLQKELERWRKNWQDTTDAVSDLIRLFESFYVIDLDDADDGPGGLEQIWRKLAGRWRPPAGQPGDRPEADDGTAYDHLTYARYHFHEDAYNQLLRIYDETDPGYYGGWEHSKLDSEVWDGPSAAAFFHIVVSPFDEAAARQIEYVRVLAAYIHLLRVFRDHTTRSLRQIVDNCITALGGADEIEPLIPGEWDPDAEGINNAVGLLTAVLDLLSVKKWGEVFLSLVGLGSATVSIGLSDEAKQAGPDQFDLHVDYIELDQHPGFVIDSCQDAVGRVKQWMSEKDTMLGRALERDMSSPTAFDSPRLWLHQPGQFSESIDFQLLNEQHGVSGPIADLRKAGRQILPNEVGGRYDDAIGKMAAIALPAWVNHFLPRTYRDYTGAQNGLLHLLRTTRNNLELWGDELVEVANEYEATDGDNARTVGSTTD
jgi:hypothetical protein